MELDEVYPLSQHEIALPLDQETINYVANQTAEYIMQQSYETVILLHNPEQWGKTVKTHCHKACQKKGINFESVNSKAGSKNILIRLDKVLRKHLSE